MKLPDIKSVVDDDRNVVGVDELQKKFMKQCILPIKIKTDSLDSFNTEEDSDSEDGDDSGDEVEFETNGVLEVESKQLLALGKHCIPTPSTPCNENIQILHSVFGDRHKPIFFMEYPSWCGFSRKRDAIGAVTVSSDVKPTWACSWERNCLNSVMKTNGFTGGKGGSTKKCTLLWTKHMTKWSSLKSTTKHCHFPGTWSIGRKDRLAMSLTKKKREHMREYQFHPESYIFPQNSDKFFQRLDRPNDKTIWIRKPVASSQGRGIKVMSLEAVKKFVNGAQKRAKKKKQASDVSSVRLPTITKPKMPPSANSFPPVQSTEKKKRKKKKSTKEKSFLFQVYLSKPLLIDDLKFDLRIYVVVTSFYPLRVYRFPEGLARFCTEKYSTGGKSNPFKHLTNYSVNKKNISFQANAGEGVDGQGSKWSMSALFDNLSKTYSPEKIDQIKGGIDDLIVKTVIAAEDEVFVKTHGNLPKASRGSCFELFGFDVMLDKDLRPWLVEVNISPSLMTDSPLDKKIKTVLICDTLHLVGLPVPDNAAIPESNSSTSTISSCATGRLSQKSSASSLRLTSQKNTIAKKDLTWEDVDDQDRMQVEVVAEEYLRRGHFERLFPPVNNPILHESYLKLFSSQRYLNTLVQKFESDALPMIP